MDKGTPATRAKNKYNSKAYDNLRIIVPKGAKQAVEEAAQKIGQSVNGYVNDAIAERMGVQSLKRFSARVTERDNIIDPATGKVHDDMGLQALAGIREYTGECNAETKQEAKEMVMCAYAEIAQKDPYDGTVGVDINSKE